MKILPDGVAADSDRMRRFEQEARAASGLNHPNIITIHEIDHAGATSFIATEFIDGTTLRERNMSPEQARGQHVNARTDIFSLGAVLYEMLTGHLPFDGSSVYEVVAAILNERETPPLSRYVSDVPAELERSRPHLPVVKPLFGCLP